MARMRRFNIICGAAAFAFVTTGAPAESPTARDAAVPAGDQDAVTLADPLHGVDGGGNVTPGATVPFGFVTLGPQTTHGSTSGYDSASPIVGFAHVFVSGTGGSSKYGNFRVTPTVGPVEPNRLAFGKTNETASPGFYGVTLGSEPGRQVGVELTASPYVGMHRYSFPSADQSALLLDVSAAILAGGSGQVATGGEIEVVDDRRISGWMSFKGGWNPAPYKLYFYAEFDRPSQSIGTWTTTLGGFVLRTGVGRVAGGDQTARSPNTATGVRAADGGGANGNINNKFGAFARFDTRDQRTVQMKLAVSFTSEAKARQHMGAEMPGWDFDATRAKASGAWRAAFAPVAIEGGTPDQRAIFRSALYRSFTMPHELTGENIWWPSTEPHYEDFYTLWDTFRTVTPLMTILHPQRQRDMLRSLLDTYKHTGWLPDARIAGANGMTQGGSNGDVVVADAIVKRLGGFDPELAYAAIKKDGDVESPDPINVGRVLSDYTRLGYVPLGRTRSASRTMEYAYNDFAIATVASALGKTEDAAHFRARARNWRNLWNPAKGCIQPRYADGRWLENYECDYQYPDATSMWWDAPFYEGSGLQYSTYVPHDVPCMIETVGGRAAYLGWLDRFFDEGNYDQGNEPSFLAAFNYAWVGRPDRTAERVRAIMAKSYRTGRRGLPGNDDAGATSAWFVWNAVGLYPNAGQPYYFIGSPVFTRTMFALEGGRRFSIMAPATSATNLYVTGATLNGKPLDRAWITHDELVKGGTLTLEMGPKPGGWATSAASSPPAPMAGKSPSCAP